MKYLFGILALIFDIVILVVYFQNIRFSCAAVFFSSYIHSASLNLYLIIISFLGGMFSVLAFSGFTSGSKDLEDDLRL